MKKILVAYLVDNIHNKSMLFDFLMSKQTSQDDVIREAKKLAALRENTLDECITLYPLQSIML